MAVGWCVCNAGMCNTPNLLAIIVSVERYPAEKEIRSGKVCVVMHEMIYVLCHTPIVVAGCAAKFSSTKHTTVVHPAVRHTHKTPNTGVNIGTEQ